MLIMTVLRPYLMLLCAYDHFSLWQVPKPRSGVAMCMHTAEDAIYIYGGYSKVGIFIVSNVFYEYVVQYQSVRHTTVLLYEMNIDHTAG